MVDFRTENQRARDMEHKKIVSMYLGYRNNPEYKDVADSRIFDIISKDPQVSISTVSGIRSVLVKNGIYQNKRQQVGNYPDAWKESCYGTANSRNQ